MLAMANDSNYVCYIIASDKTKLSSKIMIPVTRPENNRTPYGGMHDATKCVRRQHQGQVLEQGSRHLASCDILGSANLLQGEAPGYCKASTSSLFALPRAMVISTPTSIDTLHLGLQHS